MVKLRPSFLRGALFLEGNYIIGGNEGETIFLENFNTYILWFKNNHITLMS